MLFCMIFTDYDSLCRGTRESSVSRRNFVSGDGLIWFGYRFTKVRGSSAAAVSVIVPVRNRLKYFIQEFGV